MAWGEVVEVGGWQRLWSLKLQSKGMQMTRGFGHHGQMSIYICLTGKGDFGQLTIRLESVFFPQSQECRTRVTLSHSPFLTPILTRKRPLRSSLTLLDFLVICLKVFSPFACVEVFLWFSSFAFQYGDMLRVLYSKSLYGGF